MLDAIAKLLPSTTRFLHQIAPSVIATLIAAGLISGYNRAFSGHLTQPRMAALHEAGAEPAPATTTVAMTKPPAAPVTEYITILERTGEPERVAEKDPKAEAGKDQTAVKIAAPVPAAPVPAARPVAAAPAPRNEPRVASVPVVVAPAPVTVVPIAPPPVAAAPSAVPLEPPPVVAAKPYPYVTVPDRPRPATEAQAEDVPPPPPRQGPFGMIVNTLRPSSLFARAREFGERIEAAGNEILPNIRQ
jgi:hypothetical protein